MPMTVCSYKAIERGARPANSSRPYLENVMPQLKCGTEGRRRRELARHNAGMMRRMMYRSVERHFGKIKRDKMIRYVARLLAIEA